jgi:acetyl-CoA carboxylase biotin carboxyl carrier protein
MDLQLIKELIELVHSTDVGEVKIEQGNFKLSITRKDYQKKSTVQVAAPMSVATPAPVQVATTPAPEAKTATEVVSSTESAPAPVVSSNYITIKSPMIGTFYRSSSPDKAPFVKVGDKISKGDVLCIIEAMKLFNEIEAEVSGTIVKVISDNASPVEYDQPLFLIDPQ